MKRAMNNCNFLKQAATWFVLLMVKKTKALAPRVKKMVRLRRLLVIFEIKKMGKRGGERRARERRER
jgi:hypothetical protein